MVKVQYSGVTRVGDTRGGNWECHPYIFFLKNLATFFCSSLSLSLSLFIAFTRVSTLPAWGVTFFTCPTSFLHYSLLICPQHFFLRVPPSWRVSPGAVSPAPLVTPLVTGAILAVGERYIQVWAPDNGGVPFPNVITIWDGRTLWATKWRWGTAFPRVPLHKFKFNHWETSPIISTYVSPRQQMMMVRMSASRKMSNASAISSHQTHQKPDHSCVVSGG